MGRMTIKAMISDAIAQPRGDTYVFNPVAVV
jgi:hypothetical protein